MRGVPGGSGGVPGRFRRGPEGSRTGPGEGPGVIPGASYGILGGPWGARRGPRASYGILEGVPGGSGSVQGRPSTSEGCWRQVPKWPTRAPRPILGLVWGALLGAFGPPGPSADGADSLAATSLENMRGDFLSVDNITHQNDANRAT